VGAVRQSQLSEVEKTSPRNYHRREHTMVSAFVGTVLLLSGHLFQSGWFFTLCLRLRYCYMNPDEENAACEAPEEVHSLWKLRCPRVAWSNLLQCSSYRFKTFTKNIMPHIWGSTCTVVIGKFVKTLSSPGTLEAASNTYVCAHMPPLDCRGRRCQQ